MRGAVIRRHAEFSQPFQSKLKPDVLVVSRFGGGLCVCSWLMGVIGRTELLYRIFTFWEVESRSMPEIKGIVLLDDGTLDD